MKKQIKLVLTVMVTILLMGTPVLANTQQEAKTSQVSMLVDGKDAWPVGFNVSGNNYFKLRDMAYFLLGTRSQFDVEWNSQKHLIEIIRGEGQPNSPESVDSRWYSPDQSHYGTLEDTKILVDGKEHILSVFNIDNNNYFKLRDLGDLVDFDMEWYNNEALLIYSKAPDHIYSVKIPSHINRNGVVAKFPRWASPLDTHIVDNQDGTVSVIEAYEERVVIKEDKDSYETRYEDLAVKVETYDDEYKLMSQHKVAAELPVFGGFYKGKTHNYIAFGQNNEEENNQKEVIRIVRYDKDFKRVDSISVKGGEINTTKPFDSSSGRMAEEGNKLVFHTSRERYLTSDGKNHQSQLTLVIDTSKMTVLNDLVDYQRNHVSHSLDQYVLFDDGKHVLIDHGDAYPRSVILSKQNGSDYDQVDLFKIPGEIGAVCTGVSIGGFEKTGANYLVVMNTIDHSVVTKYTSYDMVGLEKDQRDIIIKTVPKNDISQSAVKQITLKGYIGTDTNASIPHLVKLSENKLMVLWQEFDLDDVAGDLRYVMIDGAGKPTGEIQTLKDFQLSKTKPIVVGNKVIWYVNSSGRRIFHTIPF